LFFIAVHVHVCKCKCMMHVYLHKKIHPSLQAWSLLRSLLALLALALTSLTPFPSYSYALEPLAQVVSLCRALRAVPNWGAPLEHADLVAETDAW